MQVTADLSVEIKKRQQNEPYILCCGDVCHSEQLSFNRRVVCEIKNSDVCALVLFNIEYTIGCSN